jgi:hypothetical protein
VEDEGHARQGGVGVVVSASARRDRRIVIPANAGIHFALALSSLDFEKQNQGKSKMDSSLRWNDGVGRAVIGVSTSVRSTSL